MDKHDRSLCFHTIDTVAGGRTGDIAFVTTFHCRLSARRLLVPKEAFEAAVGRHGDNFTEMLKEAMELSTRLVTSRELYL